MRKSFLVLLAIGLALLAAAIAPVFKSDPGLVQVHFGGWTVETSVLVLGLAVLLIWLLLWLLIRLWKLPAETARKVREQRALVQLEKGLLALTEGDWSTAERALQKSASSHGKTTARYLAAAEAAGGQEAEDRAEYYLDQADTRNRKQRFLVELTRARILVQNRQFDEALPLLENLQKRRKKHPQVLELLARCYREKGDWDAVLPLLPALEKTKVLDAEKADWWRHEAAVAGLKNCKDSEALQAAWKNIPRAMQRSPGAVMAFCEQAILLEMPELTEEVIRTAMKREWDPALLVPYGEAGKDDSTKRLKQCEKWLQAHPDDALLHLTLGRLCARGELWGKAREHLVRSLEIEPTVVGFDSLGQLLERKGELETAMACFRNALRISQGKDPLPLPGETARLSGPELTVQ